MENMIFQLSPLREGRQDHEKPVHGVYYFNSRPYVRGDSQSIQFLNSFIYFNSRPYVRGDSSTSW